MLRRLLAAALLLLPALPALDAQVSGARVRSDNDVYRFWVPASVRPDQEYSNGLHLEVETAGAVGWRRLAGGAPGCMTDSVVRCASTTFTVGQEIYTPRVDGPEPVDGQRPYAGWLYASASGSLATLRARRTAAVEVGVTGKPSGADWVQTRLHRAFGLWDPLGWNGQIPFEPAVEVRYDEQHLALRAGSVFEVVPAWGASVGNLRTEARAGVRARLGHRVPPPWRMPGAGAPRVVSAYLVGEVRGRAVARDLFLDGSTFGASPSVDRIPWVGEWEAGFGVAIRRFRAEYRVTTRSRAYRTEPGGHQFASFDLSVDRL